MLDKQLVATPGGEALLQVLPGSAAERVVFELFARALPDLLGPESSTSLPVALERHIRSLRLLPTYRRRLELAMAVGRVADHGEAEATLAESLLPATDVDIYTQAQMDLGATVCTRGRPACGRCPVAERCVALRDGRVGELPTPRPKKVVRERDGRFAVILADGAVLLERRPPTGIWGGLLSLPELPEDADTAPWVATRFGLRVRKVERLAGFRHVFTHFTLNLQPELVDAATPGACNEATLLWQALDRLDEAALPAPVRKLLLGLPSHTVASADAMANPDSLAFFVALARQLQSSTPSAEARDLRDEIPPHY